VNRSPLLATFLAALLVAAPAVANDRLEEASIWFRKGEWAFRHGDPLEAASAFDKAHQLVPHGATVYNAALAWEAAGQPQRAAQALDEALQRGGLSAVQEHDARTRLLKLTPTLGQVVLDAPAGSAITMGHVRGAQPPVKVFLTPGTYAIHVVLDDGTTMDRSMDVVIGQQHLDLHAARSTPAVAREAGSPTGRTLGWVAIGGAGVASGVAVYLGLEALEARDTFNDSGHTDADAHDRAASMRLWTNVAWAVAGASAATGVVLLLGSDEPEEASSRSEVRVSANGIVFTRPF
jgi:hypothetical protein